MQKAKKEKKKKPGLAHLLDKKLRSLGATNILFRNLVLKWFGELWLS